MTQGDHVVEEAIRHLGMREDTGRNDGLPAEVFMHGDRLPWCAAFVFKVHEWAGVRPPGNYWPMRNVSTFERTCREAGRWFRADAHVPEPGDCVFFGHRMASDRSQPGRHMGIVEQYDKERRLLHTIEGNVSNEVRRLTHDLSDEDTARSISGYARLWR